MPRYQNTSDRPQRFTLGDRAITIEPNGIVDLPSAYAYIPAARGMTWLKPAPGVDGPRARIEAAAPRPLPAPLRAASAEVHDSGVDDDGGDDDGESDEGDGDGVDDQVAAAAEAAGRPKRTRSKER